MNDVTMTFGAAVVEIGLPLLLILSCFWKKASRPRNIMLLGALTPMALYYAFVIFDFFSHHTPDTAQLLYSVWTDTFPVYALLFIIGYILSKLRKPKRLKWRYLIGLTPPVAGILFKLFLHSVPHG